jgi:hypothetical protein
MQVMPDGVPPRRWMISQSIITCPPCGDVETDCRNRLHDLAPPNRGSFNSTHIHGTHVPVEEPSTASLDAHLEAPYSSFPTI